MGMKKIAVLSLVSLMVTGVSAYATDNTNVAQERFLQKSTNFNSTAQTIKTASKQPVVNNKSAAFYSQSARQRLGYSSNTQSDQQYIFSHRSN